MAATEEEPLLVDKGSDQSDAWQLWRRELIEVCLLSGPACLQLFFQVSQVNWTTSRAYASNVIRQSRIEAAHA